MAGRKGKCYGGKKQTPASTVAAKNIAVVPAVNPEDTQKKVKLSRGQKHALKKKLALAMEAAANAVAINNVDEVANMIEKNPTPPTVTPSMVDSDCSPGAASAMKNIPPLPAATLAMEDQESPAAAPTMENNLDSPSAAPNVEDKATFPDALNTKTDQNNPLPQNSIANPTITSRLSPRPTELVNIDDNLPTSSDPTDLTSSFVNSDNVAGLESHDLAACEPNATSGLITGTTTNNGSTPPPTEQIPYPPITPSSVILASSHHDDSGKTTESPPNITAVSRRPVSMAKPENLKDDLPAFKSDLQSVREQFKEINDRKSAVQQESRVERDSMSLVTDAAKQKVEHVLDAVDNVSEVWRAKDPVLAPPGFSIMKQDSKFTNDVDFPKHSPTPPLTSSSIPHSNTVFIMDDPEKWRFTIRQLQALTSQKDPSLESLQQTADLVNAIKPFPSLLTKQTVDDTMTSVILWTLPVTPKVVGLVQGVSTFKGLAKKCGGIVMSWFSEQKKVLWG